jgi:predicted TIM-barrel fold metal-dependent hydrolase
VDKLDTSCTSNKENNKVCPLNPDHLSSFQVRIIDIHTHPVFEKKGASRSEIDDLVTYSLTLGIEKMVSLGDVVAYGLNPNEQQLKSINDTTRQIMKWHPNFFIGFCHLNPTLGEKLLRKELDRCVKLGFKGIKLEAANNARDTVMKPLMKAAEEYNLPVLQHTGDTKGKARRKIHSDSADTCLLAHRFPNVKIIMAHLFGMGIRGILEAKGLSNLWIDTSSCLPVDGLIEPAVETLGADRILYGSDIPIRELSQCIGRITGADINAKAKKKILFQNAQKLLRIA